MAVERKRRPVGSLQFRPLLNSLALDFCPSHLNRANTVPQRVYFNTVKYADKADPISFINICWKIMLSKSVMKA